MRKKWAVGLMIVGVLVLLYPTAYKWYDNRQQEKLLAAWEQEAEELARIEALQQYDALTDLFAQEPGNHAVENVSTATEVVTDEPKDKPQPPKLNSIATLKIDKIDLSLPVLEGATQKNLKYAAGHLSETTAFGKVGNAAIAAHRMKQKGRLFNRLDEMEIGDKIVVETKGETYTYTVYDVTIVDPTDVSVLNYNQTDSRLTLITCDPIVNPTHRLIVHAKM